MPVLKLSRSPTQHQLRRQTLRLLRCFFPHESNRRIRALLSFARHRLSWGYYLPTNLWKEQLVSLLYVLSGRTMTAQFCLTKLGCAIISLFKNFWIRRGNPSRSFLPIYYYYFPSSKFYICFFPSFLPLFASSFSFFLFFRTLVRSACLSDGGSFFLNPLSFRLAFLSICFKNQILYNKGCLHFTTKIISLPAKLVKHPTEYW